MNQAVKAGIACFASFLPISCNQAKLEDGNTQKEIQEKVYTVKVQQVQERSIARNLDYTANLVAFKEVNYAPSSPGRIEAIHVEVGDRIKKGQLLVEMDKTQLQQALTQLENAESNFRRVDTLYQLGSISEQQYEQTMTQYEVAKSNVKFLKENTTLESPLTGIVTGKYYESKEMYSGAPNTQAGKAAVLTLMQIQPLKARVSVAQKYFPNIKEGMNVSIKSDIYPEQKFEGEIFRVYPTINPNTRTFNLEIMIDNKSETLRPGMFAGISIELDKLKAWVVPAIAVLKEEGTNNRYVFVNDNGKADKIMVETGKRFDEMVELRTNRINKGDELIVTGQAKLLDGAKLKIVE